MPGRVVEVSEGNVGLGKGGSTGCKVVLMVGGAVVILGGCRGVETRLWRGRGKGYYSF